MTKEEREEFFGQIDELYKNRSQEMLTSFLVTHEQSKDEFRIYQDQINTMNIKMDTMNTNMVNGFKDVQSQMSSMQDRIVSVEDDVSSIKEDVTFIKDYLITNLDPRVSVLEKVTLK